VGAYRRTLRAVPAVGMGAERKTMQAEYQVVAEGLCKFRTRFPWVFPGGERPPGYKGVAGNVGVMFAPRGFARWAGQQYEADGVFPYWRVVSLGGFAVLFLSVGVEAAWREYVMGNWFRWTTSLALSAIPLVLGAFWWQREVRLFRAIAEEIAQDLEHTAKSRNLGDA
jgi:hypothetical protein